MQKLFSKFRDWDKQRAERYSLEQWPATRAKGRGLYVLKFGLFVAAFSAIAIFVWEWVETNGLSLRGGFPSSRIYFLLFKTAIGYIIGCITGWLNWNWVEKRYSALIASDRNANKETAL